MDLNSTLESVLGLLNNNFNLTDLLGKFLNSNDQKSNNGKEQILNPNDDVWKLPNYNFESNNQNDFQKTKQKETEASPFNAETILKIANIFGNLTKQKKEDKTNSSSFISSLIRCDTP